MLLVFAILARGALCVPKLVLRRLEETASNCASQTPLFAFQRTSGRRSGFEDSLRKCACGQAPLEGHAPKVGRRPLALTVFYLARLLPSRTPFGRARGRPTSAQAPLSLFPHLSSFSGFRSLLLGRSLAARFGSLAAKRQSKCESKRARSLSVTLARDSDGPRSHWTPLERPQWTTSSPDSIGGARRASIGQKTHVFVALGRRATR